MGKRSVNYQTRASSRFKPKRFYVGGASLRDFKRATCARFHHCQIRAQKKLICEAPALSFDPGVESQHHASYPPPPCLLISSPFCHSVDAGEPATPAHVRQSCRQTRRRRRRIQTQKIQRVASCHQNCYKSCFQGGQLSVTDLVDR